MMIAKPAEGLLGCRIRYVDTFVIWPYGPDKLNGFLNHLNSSHQFTMETEREGHFPFLDMDIYRRPDGSLGHSVQQTQRYESLPQR
jgi:hypothetical protein